MDVDWDYDSTYDDFYSYNSKDFDEGWNAEVLDFPDHYDAEYPDDEE